MDRFLLYPLFTIGSGLTLLGVVFYSKALCSQWKQLYNVERYARGYMRQLREQQFTTRETLSQMQDLQQVLDSKTVHWLLKNKKKTLSNRIAWYIDTLHDDILDQEQ